MQICSKSKSLSGGLSEMTWKTQTGELTHQVLIGDEKLVVEFRASAVKLRGRAERAAHCVVLGFRAVVHLAGTRCADEQVLRGIERRNILNDRNLVAFGFQLERTHAVGRTSLKRALNTPNLVSGSSPGMVY